MTLKVRQIIKSKRLIDSIRLKVTGGSGGPGLPRYGGVGGKGGDVYAQGSTRLTSLKSVIKKYPTCHVSGMDGRASLRTRLVGESGRETVIKVPLGVTINDDNDQFLGDINQPKDKILLAIGGRGGDKFNDNLGFKGQERKLKINLKLMSDCVFVGFPNAGKSSLLSVVSDATPKIASYPFTTLEPNLGVVQFEDFRRLTMADLPGLVEDAHKNVGLGHEFLKHIERTKLLVFTLDINPVDLGPNYKCRSPLENLCILNREIELYDDRILEKPAMLLITKTDTVKNAKDHCKRLEDELQALRENYSSPHDLVDDTIKPTYLIEFDRIIPVSSKTRYNIHLFKESAREVIDKYAYERKVAEDGFSKFEDLLPLETNRLV